MERAFPVIQPSSFLIKKYTHQESYIGIYLTHGSLYEQAWQSALLLGANEKSNQTYTIFWDNFLRVFDFPNNVRFNFLSIYLFIKLMNSWDHRHMLIVIHLLKL